MPNPVSINKTNLIHSMIRVNHAGEYAAKRIYQGQLANISDAKSQKLIRTMMEQELEHLAYFEDQIRARKIRPTALFPLWHILSYGLGAITATMGPKSAMMCTEAVESVIDEHYQDQLSQLDNTERDLKSKIERFRQEELEHKHTAIENDAYNSPMHFLLSNMIKGACRVAISISKRF